MRSIRFCTRLTPGPDCVICLQTPVIPWQHLSQLPSEPARHSARSAAVANLGHTHALSLTYLGAAHLVALVPSHVWPLGQSVHTLSLTYLVAAHSVRTSLPWSSFPESSVSPPGREKVSVPAPPYE